MSVALENFGPKVEAHIRYRLADGTIVPGATTVIGVLNKPALVGWANRLGLQGIDSTKYRDEAAQVGTLAHYLVESHLLGREPDLDDYTPAQLRRAQHGLDAFLEWEAGHHYESILAEAPMVSEKFRFAGTIDNLALVDDHLTVLDFKTSGAVYDEHRIQVSAYRKLAEENGHKISGVRILRIPRIETDSLEEHVLSAAQTDLGWQMFRHCLALYSLQKRMRQGGKSNV